MSSNLLSFGAWTFLPNLVTNFLQGLYYSLTIRAGSPKPQPGTPRHARHRRIIYLLVVSTYLLYTIIEADYEIRRASNFYTDLGLPPSATDRDIKSRFRRLAAIHHPDKLSSSPASSAAESNSRFVHLKLAQDTLLSPAKRFAYERFGPDMLKWQRCSSIRDYTLQGVQAILPYYSAAGVVMYILSLLGYLEWGKYWRFLTLFILCVFELHAITRPHFPLVASRFLNPILTTFTNYPPYLPFQLIQLFRKMSVTFYIALSQIGPLLQPPSSSPATAGIQAAGSSSNPDAALQQYLDRMEAQARAADVEVMRLLETEMSPFRGDSDALGALRAKAKEWLVHSTVRNDPFVKDAMGKVLRRRVEEVPRGGSR